MRLHSFDQMNKYQGGFREDQLKLGRYLLEKLNFGPFENCLFFPAECHVVLVPHYVRPDVVVKYTPLEHKGVNSVRSETKRLLEVAEKKICHMQVPRVLDNGKRYVVLKRMGPDLETVEEEQGFIPNSIIGALQLARMQAALWKECGFYHTDIKSDNLTYEGGDRFGMIDFHSMSRAVPKTYDVLIGIANLDAAALIPGAQIFEEHTGIKMHLKRFVEMLLRYDRRDKAVLVKVLDTVKRINPTNHRPETPKARVQAIVNNLT